MKAMQKNWEELEISLQEIRENGESIQVELEASKKLEVALNQKIEELQKQLEIHREFRSCTAQQSKRYIYIAGRFAATGSLSRRILHVSMGDASFERSGELDQNKGNTAEEISQRKRRFRAEKTIEESTEILQVRQKSRHRPKTEKR